MLSPKAREAKRARDRAYYAKKKGGPVRPAGLKRPPDTPFNGTSRDHMLWVRYRLTESDFDRMAQAQGGVCAICKQAKKLHVDHCHVTGKVRGLLCMTCNTAIGKLGSDPEIIQRAIDYLSRN